MGPPHHGADPDLRVRLTCTTCTVLTRTMLRIMHVPLPVGWPTENLKVNVLLLFAHTPRTRGSVGAPPRGGARAPSRAGSLTEWHYYLYLFCLIERIDYF